MRIDQDNFIHISEQLLAKGHNIKAQVFGGSMRPWIKNGSVLWFGPIDPKRVCIGDVLLYKTKQNNCIVHRVIARRSKQNKLEFFVKADAHSVFPELIAADQILGRAIAVEINNKKIDLLSKRYKIKQKLFTAISILSFLVFPLAKFLRKLLRTPFQIIFLFLQNLRIYRTLLSGSNRMISYRIAERSDALAIAYFYDHRHSSGFYDNVLNIEKHISDPAGSGYYLLAENKNKVIGCVSLSPGDESGFWMIDGLFVSWLFRGMGIGETLLAAAEKLALFKGAEKIRLKVSKKAKPALSLYQKQGFIIDLESRTADRRINMELTLAQKNIFKYKPEKAKQGFKALAGFFLSSFLQQDNPIQPLVFFTGDWDDFFAYAQKNRISPLIYAQLKQHEQWRKIVPDEFFNKCKTAYYTTAANNTMLIERLKEILALAQQKGIEVLVLKGVFLLEKIYKDAGLRFMDDADILLKQEDLRGFHAVLNDLGYDPDRDIDDLINQPKSSAINTVCYRRNKEDHLFIHVHRHIINSTWPLGKWADDINIADIWAEADKFNLNGLNIMSLNPQDNLLFLAGHSFTHACERLIWLMDISLFIKAFESQIRTDEFFNKAEQWDMLVPLDYVFRQCAILGIKGENSQLFKSRKLRLNPILKYLFKQKPSYAISYFLYLFLQPDMGARIDFLRSTVFPPKFVMSLCTGLPVDKVKWFHYFKRFMKNIG